MDLTQNDSVLQLHKALYFEILRGRNLKVDGCI